MKVELPTSIKGGSFEDERGRLSFVNDFDMSQVKRVYFTEHFSEDVIRAWQAHKIEQRWFLCVQGGFTIKLVCVDDFDHPSADLTVHEFSINENEPQIVHVPEGYANGIQATEPNSKLMIFSDYLFGENPDDQVRFDKNMWTTWNS